MIYGNLKLEANESHNYISEFNKINEQQFVADINSIYAHLYESEDNENDVDSLEEGANYDIIKACRPIYKEYRINLKNAKKAIKKHDYSNAKKDILSAKSNLNKIKDELDKIAKEGEVDSVGSIVCGFFLNGLLNDAEMILPLGITIASAGITAAAGVNNANKIAAAVATATTDINSMDGVAVDAAIKSTKGLVVSASATGIIATVCEVWVIIKEIVILVKDIIEFINQVKKSDNKNNNYLNFFFVKCNRYISDMDKSLDKLSKKVTEIAKEDK